MKRILSGTLVRLCSESPEAMARLEAVWMTDSEYFRIMDADPMRLWSQRHYKQRGESRVSEPTDEGYFLFSIRTVAEDNLIGDTMFRVHWPQAEGIFGIAIGERTFWGRGYGTQAAGLMLEYAFLELNLRRVTLTVLDYNARAIRSYEKAGFRPEGRVRKLYQRDGMRHDQVHMGILREEWLGGAS